MATSTYLSNPVVTVNAVDLTDQCTAAVFTQRYDQLENTTFGKTARTFQAGLGNHEVTLTLYNSYASAETFATLENVVGGLVNVIVKPAVGADGPTNPGFTLTGALLAELPVVNATMGELSTIDVTFVGGVYTADVTP
jgi:hypothetical protein